MHGRQAATDDVRRPAAGAGEGRGGGTVRGLRGARVHAALAEGRAGTHASRSPKSRAILARLYSNRIVCLFGQRRGLCGSRGAGFLSLSLSLSALWVSSAETSSVEL